MRTALLLTFSLIIVGGFLLYMSTYTVRFSDAVVVTTFGQADQNDVITEPGLRLKWPTPVQSVTVYDTRARFLSTKHETQQTGDDRQIVVESFLAWKVADPLVFYQRFRGSAGGNARDHYARAEETLTSALRSAMSEVSKYRLGELFAGETGASKLPDLEKDIATRLRDPQGGNVGQFGVEVVLVGISDVVLPKDTSAEVFNRMSESRKRLAAQAESEGKALATAIRSDAENAAKRIREFARLRADQIRSRGDLEAATYLTALSEDEGLATFLKNLELLKNGLGRRATVVMSTDFPGIHLFSPEALEDVGRGKIPDFVPPKKPAPTADQPATPAAQAPTPAAQPAGAAGRNDR